MRRSVILVPLLLVFLASLLAVQPIVAEQTESAISRQQSIGTEHSAVDARHQDSGGPATRVVSVTTPSNTTLSISGNPAVGSHPNGGTNQPKAFATAEPASLSTEVGVARFEEVTSAEKTTSLGAVMALQNQAPVFVENRGQWDSQVRFQLQRGGKTLWVTKTDLVFDIPRTEAADNAPDRPSSTLQIDARQRLVQLPNQLVPLNSSLLFNHEPLTNSERLVFSEELVGANTQ